MKYIEVTQPHYRPVQYDKTAKHSNRQGHTSRRHQSIIRRIQSMLFRRCCGINLFGVDALGPRLFNAIR